MQPSSRRISKEKFNALIENNQGGLTAVKLAPRLHEGQVGAVAMVFEEIEVSDVPLSLSRSQLTSALRKYTATSDFYSFTHELRILGLPLYILTDRDEKMTSRYFYSSHFTPHKFRCVKDILN